jgi:hypothetical protein
MFCCCNRVKRVAGIFKWEDDSVDGDSNKRKTEMGKIEHLVEQNWQRKQKYSEKRAPVPLILPQILLKLTQG